MHVIETDRTILEAEDGLILGNGDLSVSVYQRGEHLVWRFGKTDVWDRRVDTSDDEPGNVEVIAQTGKPHPFTIEDARFICFETERGARYEVAPVG